MPTIDPNTTTITKWQASDLAARGRVGLSKLIQLMNNDNAAANLIARSFNPWNLGSDAYDHFERDVDAANWWLQKTLVGTGAVTLDEAAHLLSLDSVAANGSAIVHTRGRRRSDRVPSLVEARVFYSAHVTTSSPLVGFVSSLGNLFNSVPTDGAWFERGTNSNTYKARTRSASTDRETTDNLAANFLSWDELRVELDGTQARFYINDVLVATHTISLPTTVLLNGAVGAHDNNSGAGRVLKVDYFVRAALQDSLSP